MAVGFPLKTTYADGDVYSASDVNDTNGTINLFTSSTLSVAAGKNAIINGGMDIWQRGTSFPNITGLIYTADRFQGSLGSMTSGTLSVSRQASGLDAFEYSMRFQRNSGATTTGNGYLTYSTETKNVIPLQGKAVRFSFYARAGANFSMASSTLSFALSTGTGVDLNINTGSFPTSVISASPVLTTSWQRFTYSGTISATAASLGFYWMYTGVGTAGANDWFEITGVQLELGSTATTFSRAGGTIQGELAACQRYYSKSYMQGTAVPTNTQTTGTEIGIAQGVVPSGSIFALVRLPIIMRVAPSVTVYSYNTSQTNRVSDGGGVDLAANSGNPVYISDRVVGINNNSGGNITPAGQHFLFHWSASAEL